MPRSQKWRLTVSLLLAVGTLLQAAKGSAAQTTQQTRIVGATSLEALRQSYLDAARTKQPQKLSDLFEWTGMSPEVRSQALADFAKDFDYEIASATLRDPRPEDLADLAGSTLHLNHPAVKILEASYVKDGSLKTRFYVGRCGVGFCLLNIVAPPDPTNKIERQP